MREFKRSTLPLIVRVIIFLLCVSIILAPGCKSGRGIAIPDEVNIPTPFTPDRPGVPLAESRSGGESGGPDSSQPMLRFTGPKEITEYEYKVRTTMIQMPEFEVELLGFDGFADSSMFKCFIDGSQGTRFTSSRTP